MYVCPIFFFFFFFFLFFSFFLADLPMGMVGRSADGYIVGMHIPTYVHVDFRLSFRTRRRARVASAPTISRGRARLRTRSRSIGQELECRYITQ